MAEAEPEFCVPSLSSQEVADSSSESDEEAPLVVKKNRGSGLKYTLIKSFAKKDDFEQWWKDEKVKWNFEKNYSNKHEEIDRWKCHYSVMKGYSCNACVKVLFPNTDDSVKVYRSDNEHTHELAQPAHGLPKELEGRILQMTKQGLTPKRIHVQFTEEKVDPLPALEKIQWFVSRQRKSNSEPVTDNQLREYCELHSQEPADENQAFVLAYDIASTSSFYIVWTTKKLLQRQLESKQLQADATSSVNWHNWPLLVLGLSDLNRHCIATMLAVGKSEDTYVYSGVFLALKNRGYNPESVLGDGAGAITAAAKRHFPRALRLMCFPHLIRRVDVHKKSMPQELQEAFRSDICMLQYSRNEVEFRRLSKLMVTVWMDAAHHSVPEFATYFNDTWLESDLNRWSEGESQSCLNNNGIESVNLRIKSDHTVRKMQNFSVFMDKVEKLLNYWAVNLRAVPIKPDIPLRTYKAAYELQNECESGKRLLIKLRNPAKYVIASAKSSFANNEQLHEAYKASFHTGPRSREEYLQLRFIVHVVESSPLGPFFTCSCPEGSKKEPCKHAAMVMCALEKTCAYPPQVTAKEMQANRKRKNTAGRDPLAPTQNRYDAL
ncbi:hypothetical protein AAVH_24386 [Aphelenchoides avenae]|nr:hypothetical protein AAVH_24386 [Aphelenchus avenae]